MDRGSGVSGGSASAWLLGLVASAVAALATGLPSTAMAAGWVEPSPGPLNVEQTNSAGFASVTDVGGVPYVAWSESTPDSARSYVFVTRLTGGTWDGVGGLIDQHGAAPEITTIGGVPYLAYGQTQTGQVYVDRLNNGVWETIGGAPLATPINDGRNQANWVSVAGDSHDGEAHPFVAWDENGPGFLGRVYVSEFVRGAWRSTTPGGSLNVDPNDVSGYPHLAEVNGTLWITWLEHFSGNGWTVVVKRFDGTQWVSAGSPQDGRIATDADAPSIADVGGVPFIAWDDVSGGTRAMHVARYDPNAVPNWVPIGGPFGLVSSPPGVGGYYRESSITSVNGVPWVAWTDASGAVRRVQVAQFAAGRWETVFGPLNSDPTKSAGSPAIASAGGLPYVAFTQTTTNTLNGFPWQIRVEVPQHETPFRVTSIATTHTQAGVMFAIGLARAATVRLEITHPALGRMVAGACVAQTADNARKPRCTRVATVGTVRIHGHAGINRITFDGRTSNIPKLSPGHYRVTITLTDAAAHNSQPRSASFIV